MSAKKQELPEDSDMGPRKATLCLKYPRLVNVVVTSGYGGVSSYAGSLLFHSGEGTMVSRVGGLLCALPRWP